MKGSTRAPAGDVILLQRLVVDLDELALDQSRQILRHADVSFLRVDIANDASLRVEILAQRHLRSLEFHAKRHARGIVDRHPAILHRR